jgi:uncharacterized protein
MNLHHVHLQDCEPKPWRNGGGLTRELLVWPSPQRWQLRISVARIDGDGPFSPFAGVQRWFAVLHGAGVRLDLPRGVVTQTTGDDPLAFDGEAAPMCTLLEGPTEDLNLMAPRDAGQARMQRALPGSGIDRATRWRGLFAVERALLDIDDRTEGVAAGTLAWTDDAEAPPWKLHHGSRAFWLSLEA